MTAATRATRRSRLGPGDVLVTLGALLAGGSFFLPYLRLIRLLGASVTVTGVRIGGALWLVPAAATLILLLHFGIPRRRARLRAALELLTAAFGLLIVLAVILKLHRHTRLLFIGVSAAGLGVRPAGGWVLSLVGFALALLGALL